MMKKFVVLTLSFFLCLSTVLGLDLDIASENVYFYNITRDEVIYEIDSDEVISIASLTKIMTAWIAIENIDNLDAEVTITEADLKGLKEENASVAGFKVGEVVTYRDLIYALMLPSGADAAQALANNLAGGNENFVKLMNYKAWRLGLKNTRFVNTTGLDAEGQYSSAEEVAILLRESLKNETFWELFTTDIYRSSNGKYTFKSTLLRLSESNNLETDYILGSKSGYTYAAGLCLASITEHEGELYILITANAEYKSKKPHQVIDTNTIYRYFFSNYSYRTIVKEGDIIATIEAKNGDELVFTTRETLELYVPNDAIINGKYTGVDLVTYDMKKGEKLGVYEVYIDGELAFSEEIVLNETIPRPKRTGIVPVIIVFVIVGFSIYKLRKVNKNKKKKLLRNKKTYSFE